MRLNFIAKIWFIVSEHFAGYSSIVAYTVFTLVIHTLIS
jgi:hypothetical protein